MRLEGCVRREGPHAYCMFIRIELLPVEMMSAYAHSMMMSANVHECECTQMRCSWGAWHYGVPLTSGRHYRLAWPESLGGVRAPWGFTLACVSHVYGSTTHLICPRLEATLMMIRDRSLNHDCMCLHLYGPYSGATYWVFFEILKLCATSFFK